MYRSLPTSEPMVFIRILSYLWESVYSSQYKTFVIVRTNRRYSFHQSPDIT